ncbi:MAG TPA: TonB-dependent receptor, partial [Rhodanobacteraceae bacterium]
MKLRKNLLAFAIASACLNVGGVAWASSAGTPFPDAVAQAQTGPAEAAAVQQSTTATAKAAKKAKQPKQSEQAKVTQTLETITVTGFTRSIESSLAYQRYSNEIANFVTAADISGLPDQSIADALTRLPGIAAQRIGGQASQINMRGLTGNFIQTTLNGVVQPSTSGSNYIQFDDYPSELINRVAVYKSSSANLIEGGIGGNIAMETANPLDNAKQQSFNLDVRGSYNSQANQIVGDSSRAYRVSGAYQGKFLHDTLGIGLGFAQLFQPQVSEQFVNESYSQNPVMLDGRPVLVNAGIQLNQQGGSERRNGYLATVVWKPNQHFSMDATGFFSKFNQGAIQRGLMAQQFFEGLTVITNPVVSGNDTLVGGTVGSIPGGFFGIPGLQAFSIASTANNQSNHANTFTGVVRAHWHDGPWDAMASFSSAHAGSNTVGSFVTADPFNGLDTGAPRLADQQLTFALHGLHVGDFSVADPAMLTDLGKVALDYYGLTPTTYRDRNKAFRATVKYTFLDNPFLSAVEGGVYLQNHRYNAERAFWAYGTQWGQYFLSNPAQPPLALDASNAQTACWKGKLFGGFPCFLAINADAVLAAHNIHPNPVKTWTQNWTETQSGGVNVQVRDAFFQADIDTQLFGHELTGNAGLRVVHTSQFSPGLEQVGTGNGVPIADGNGVISTDYLPVNPGQSYTNYLPSLNLAWHIDDGNQIRFAAAKVMSRPPIDMLKSGVASFVSNGTTYNLTSGTSPSLKPMYATQFDVAYEHYFPDSSGVFVADLFHKHIESFVQTITINDFDFAGNGYTVPINPATGKPYLNGEFQTAFN